MKKKLAAILTTATVMLVVSACGSAEKREMAERIAQLEEENEELEDECEELKERNKELEDQQKELQGGYEGLEQRSDNSREDLLPTADASADDSAVPAEDEWTASEGGQSEEDGDTETKKVVHIGPSAPLKEKPRSTSSVIAFVETGEGFDYLGTSEDGGWYQIDYFGEAYWVTSIGTEIIAMNAEEYAEQQESMKEIYEAPVEDITASAAAARTPDELKAKEEQLGEDTNAGTKTVVWIVKSAPLKEEAEGNSLKVASLASDDVYDYLGVSEDGRWYRINYFGAEYWVTYKAVKVVELSPEEYEKEQERMRDKYTIPD